MTVNQFGEFVKFKKAVQEDRIEDAEVHLDDLQERLEDVKMERKAKELDVKVKHREMLEYDVEGHGSFVAYQFNDKSKYVTANTVHDALVKFGEEYRGEQ